VRQGLIPVGHRGEVVLQGVVTRVGQAEIFPAEITPAQRLHRDAQVLFEEDRILQVETVERHARSGLAGFTHDVLEAKVWDRVIIFIKTPRPTEVILGAGAANRRPLLVAVEIHLDLPLAPPAGTVLLPAHEGADKVSMAAHAIEDGIDILVRHGIGPAELRVEIKAVRRHFLQGVIKGVEEVRDIGRGIIFHRDAGVLFERHREEAVHATLRIHIDRQGVDVLVAVPRLAKEIPDWALNGRMLRAIPVDSQNDLPTQALVERHPHMSDDAGAIVIHEGLRLTRFERQTWGNFPAAPEMRRLLPRTGGERRLLGGHAASALIAPEVFGRQRARLGLAFAEDIGEINGGGHIASGGEIRLGAARRANAPASRAPRHTNSCCCGP